jgi:hypothetical protein
VHGVRAIAVPSGRPFFARLGEKIVFLERSQARLPPASTSRRYRASLLFKKRAERLHELCLGRLLL